MAVTTKNKTPRTRKNPEPEPRRRTSTASAQSEEDRQDIEDAHKSLAEAKKNGFYTWESVKREMGL
jgi:hypothetical protein